MAITLLPDNPYNLLKRLFRGMFLKINEIITDINGGTALPYLVYEAQLVQASTNAPVATELVNSLGGAVTTAYVSTGRYEMKSAGLFTANKTLQWINNVDTGGNVTINSRWIDSSTIQIYALVLNTSTGVTTEVDDLIPLNSIMIHVYL